MTRRNVLEVFWNVSQWVVLMGLLECEVLGKVDVVSQVFHPFDVSSSALATIFPPDPWTSSAYFPPLGFNYQPVLVPFTQDCLMEGHELPALPPFTALKKTLTILLVNIWK